jgi:hypothetical protein
MNNAVYALSFLSFVTSSFFVVQFKTGMLQEYLNSWRPIFLNFGNFNVLFGNNFLSLTQQTHNIE